ncbi:MAG: efflux RND transporter permease subunit [Kiritimatiellae bacterium]|nr:efflux RND transporter permease subunit [Kiritimatiellia bacterium]
MTLPEIGVRRPVTTLMVFFAVLILGAISWTRLAVDMMPEIESPSISVYTRWDGASTEDVEQQVTRVIESALGSVTDLDEISSSTSEGASRVTCKFKWGTELGEAANDMRDLLERAKRRLPDDADDPIMYKFNTANMPVLGFSVTATENIEKLEDTVNDDIVDVLKRVPGVGTAEAFGGLVRQINVYLDPAKLSAYGLSVQEIAAAIDADNQTEPAGNVKIGTLDYTIRVPGEFSDPSEVGLVVVKRDGDRVVRVRDIARVEDGFEEETRIVERKGRAGMMVDVQKRSGENTMAVCRRVLERLEEIKRNLPADYSIDLVFDNSDMIGKSIRSVGQTVLWGGLFVILVTLFFLRNIRTSIIIALTIPFSLIIAFAFMFLRGWTINLMSLSALALAVGMVVDNAVVVLENIISHVSRGESRAEAAIGAAGEVGTAIMASTLTTIVVFVPLVFVDGVTGIMLGQLGGIVTATLCASVVCSLLLTPMLASRLLRGAPSGDTAYARFYAWSEGRFGAFERLYGRVLSAALRRRWAILAAAAAVIAATVFSFRSLGSEFMGKEDTGQLTITYQLPLSTRYELTAETGRRIIDVVHRVCGEGNIVSEMLRAGGSGGLRGGGSHIGLIRLRLVDAKFRDRTADEYGDEITREVSKWPEVVKIYSNSGSFLNRILRGGGANLLVEVYGYDLDQTSELAARIKAIAEETPGARDVRISQDMGKPELSVEIDRAKASALGLDMATVTATISALFQGDDASEYREGEDEYDITLRLDAAERETIEDIRRTELNLPDGGRVRLDTIAQVVEGTGPVTISRKNQQRLVSVEFDATDDRPEGDVMADVRRRIESELMLPDGVSIEYGGMIEEQEESERALSLMIALGTVLVYMVMAAQFESLLHPLLIMFSVPFAFGGVSAALHATGTPLSMSAYIGMVLLVGIVVNNAIVLIDFVNLLRRRGRPLREAIVEGGRQRLRPVLITTFTTILGMLPMAISHGDGSATWRPLGIVVVGGLSFATLVSMILVPTLYYMVEKRGRP